MKICLTCSSGGHLDELLNIVDVFYGHDLFFVLAKTQKTEKIEELARVYYVKNAPSLYDISKSKVKIRKALHFLPLIKYNLLILLDCFNILWNERPQLIFGSGSEPTIIVIILGKLLGAKIVYLESLTRIKELSITGRISYYISDLFLVQWPQLAVKYKKSKYWGKVI